MNITDILIVLGIIVFIILGVRDGLMKKIFGIFGFLGGLICATKFVTPFSEVLIEWLSFSKEAAIILAFFTIFILIVILVNLLYRWFGQSSGDAIKAWSRIAGGLLGAVQGAIAVSLILVMFNLFDLPTEETKIESLLYDEVFPIAPKVFDYTTKWMPDSKMFFDEIKDVIESVKSR